MSSVAMSCPVAWILFARETHWLKCCIASVLFRDQDRHGAAVPSTVSTGLFNRNAPRSGDATRTRPTNRVGRGRGHRRGPRRGGGPARRCGARSLMRAGTTATVVVGPTSIPTRSAPGSGDVFEAAASVDVLGCTPSTVTKWSQDFRHSTDSRAQVGRTGRWGRMKPHDSDEPAPHGRFAPVLNLSHRPTRLA